MKKNIELKDTLYYEDLIYAIKKIGNIEYTENKDTEERIRTRLQPVYDEKEKQENEIVGEELSDFELDLFLVIRKIGKRAGDPFKSIENIRKYPELIQKEILVLQDKKIENDILNHLKYVVENMGYKDYFHLGESAEQRVCLFKRNNLWEVYIVERGISFDKAVFEECFDACIEVINQLADSKETFEKGKESFSIIKKLIPQKNK